VENIKILICGPKEMCEGLENVIGRELDLDIKLLKKKKIWIY